MDHGAQVDLGGVTGHAVGASGEQSHASVMRRVVREHKDAGLLTDGSQPLNYIGLGRLAEKRDLRSCSSKRALECPVRKAAIEDTQSTVIPQQRYQTDRDDRIKPSKDDAHAFCRSVSLSMCSWVAIHSPRQMFVPAAWQGATINWPMPRVIRAAHASLLCAGASGHPAPAHLSLLRLPLGRQLLASRRSTTCPRMSATPSARHCM